MKKILRRIKLQTYIALILLLVLVPIVFFSLFHPGSSQAAWYSDSWAYREKIPVTAHTAAENNVYLGITVDTATLTTAKLQADCDDLRFTDINGRLLPYQIVSGCDSATTSIRVGFDTMPAAPFDFYMYYGNPYATVGAITLPHSACGNSCAAGTFGSEEIGPGPVAYWRFDEGVDNTCSDGTSDACDQGPNKDDLANTSAIWRTEDLCLSGKCLNYNGTSTYLSWGSNATSNTTEFTIQGWIKPTQLSQGALAVYNGDDNGGYGFGMSDGGGGGTNGTHIVGLYGAVTWIDSGYSISSTGQWIFVALTRTGTTTKIYVNGQSQPNLAFNNGASTDNPLTPNAKFTVGMEYDGTSTPSRYFTGDIDEVKVYSYARSADQVKADYTSRGSTKGVSAQIGQTDTSSYLNNGLVGYWKEDETSNGAAAVDYSGHGTNLTDAATVVRATGEFANAGDFESSSSQYQYVADNSTLSITGSLTLSAWIKPESVSSGTWNIVGKWDGSNESYRLYQSTNQIILEIESGNTVTSTTTLTAATWYHIVGTYNAANQTASIYINGAPVTTTSSGTIPTAIADDAGDFQIGTEDRNNTPKNFYDGIIDEIRVYNRNLSSAEVMQLYNWAPGPVGEWKLDENTGQSVKDTSGNGLNGTLGANSSPSTDDPTWVPGRYGSGLNFDGSDLVNVPDNAKLRPGNGSWTVEIWAKPPDIDQRTVLVSKWLTSGSVVQYILSFCGDIDCVTSGQHVTASFGEGDGTPLRAVMSDSDDIDGNWHMYTMVADKNADTIYIYKDGTRLTTTNANAGSWPTITNTDDLYFGYLIGQEIYYTGLLDDVKIYNYPRSSSQVTQDLNADHPIGGSPIGSQVLYWKFDEHQGTTANNSGNSGSTSNGTLTSIATPATATSGWTDSGKLNTGIIFDGSNDNVALATANEAAVDFNGAEAFSASAWVYVTTMPGSGEFDAIITKWDATSALRDYRLAVTNDDADTTGNFYAAIYDESADQTISAAGANDTVSVNTWYHVVFTFNGGTAGAAGDLKLYVNGVNVASNTANASFLGLEDKAADFTVGDYDTNEATAANTPFTGTIDEVKVYAAMLTADQVLIDLNQTSSISINPLTSATNEASYLIDGAGNPPIAYWNFDENTGDPLDHSGNEFTGTWHGTASHWAPGKYGSSGFFGSTTSDYVEVSDDDKLSFGNGTTDSPMSISAWVKMKDATGFDVVSKGDPSTVGEYQLTAGSSADKFFFNAIDQSTGGWIGRNYNTALTSYENQWIFLTATYDGSATNAGVKLYLNGARVDDTDDSGGSYTAMENQTGTLDLGTDFSRYANGQIDDVKIYNYVRTQSQIAYDYNRGRPFGYWKLDDCQGTTAYDSSGNGYNGTLTITGQSVGTCATGSTAWGTGATGKFNGSLYLDGTGDYVATVNGNSVRNLSQASVSVWFKPTSISGDQELYFEPINADATTRLNIVLNSSGNCIIGGRAPDNIGGGYSDWVTSSNTATAGQWNHCVGVFNSSTDTHTVYLNGVATSASFTLSAFTDSAPSAPARIGIDTSGGDPFTGQIDDVRLYKYPLSATQVKILYNEGSAARFGPQTGSP